jgi:hypothetical protein
VNAIDPAQRTGLEAITLVAAVAIADPDRDHPVLGDVSPRFR